MGFLNFLYEDILPYILKVTMSYILENCICCLDNWVLDNLSTNLDQKQNIWHFNRGSITFCALNDAHKWLYDYVKIGCLVKISFSIYRPNCSLAIKLQDFLNFNVSETI